AEPYVGMDGQKIQRPETTRSAGISVSTATNADRTPIAATGPIPCVDDVVATVRQSMPAVTVAALATIAGVARRRAAAAAGRRSVWRRSSSRYRAVSRSA